MKKKTTTRRKTAEIEYPMADTRFGWANISLDPPHRLDMPWMKMPEGHVYVWEGDGWHRVEPPEKNFLPDGDLPHP